MGLYFAYGSNLNIKQMQMRCPASTPVKRLTVHDWKLVFRGVADVTPRKGMKLEGALWEITDECEEALDLYEGVEGGMYRKQYFDYEDQEVLVYLMNERGVMPPGDFYVHVIREGYKDFGIPMDSLDAAVNEAWKDKRPTPALKVRRSREASRGIKRYSNVIEGEYRLLKGPNHIG